MQEFAMRVTVLLLSLSVGLTPTLHADDGAASIAAGGIIVMKRETRIVMAKEVLTISPRQVLVDYDFRNDSEGDITTEVAFPIPEYGFADDMGRETIAQQGFDDFKLWVAGEPRTFNIETRAFVGKREVTALLAQEHIDAATFGHWDEKEHDFSSSGRDFEKASDASRRKLIVAGAYDKDKEPSWKVRKKYYWTQVFPAHAIVHIRHQYSPVLGNSNTIGDPAIYQGKDASPEYAESCPTPAVRDTLSKVWNRPGAHDEVSPLWIVYVSFILTTANTWKTPIEDFTLIVERPHDPKYKTYVSFCWDGPVTQIDADHFSAHITGFVPKKELQVGFIREHAPDAK
jgi:hypothetical protein